MSEELLSIRKVCDRISFSRSWLYAAMKAGEFPKPLSLPYGKSLWPASQVERWIQERVASGASE